VNQWSCVLSKATFVLLFDPVPDDPHWYVLPFFFLPEDSMEQRSKRDRVPYDLWHRQGLFQLTPGNVIDYRAIRKKVNELRELYRIQEIAFDAWNSSDLVTNLTDDGQVWPGLRFDVGANQAAHGTSSFGRTGARQQSGASVDGLERDGPDGSGGKYQAGQREVSGKNRRHRWPDHGGRPFDGPVGTTVHKPRSLMALKTGNQWV
jgi:hypothetical protein